MSQPPAGPSAAERRLAQLVEHSSERVAAASPAAPRIDLVWGEGQQPMGTAGPHRRGPWRHA